MASIQIASKHPHFTQLCKPSPLEEEHLWILGTSAALAPGNPFCLLLGCYALLILIGPASEKIGAQERILRNPAATAGCWDAEPSLLL